MTTKSVKPVVRETSAFVRDRGLRPIIATIHHGTLILRAKGLRSEETLDLGSLYHYAVKNRVWRENMDKAKVRAAKRPAKKK